MKRGPHRGPGLQAEVVQVRCFCFPGQKRCLRAGSADSAFLLITKHFVISDSQMVQRPVYAEYQLAVCLFV